MTDLTKGVKVKNSNLLQKGDYNVEKYENGTHNTFKTLGSSNHCEYPREQNDYYATDPKAVEMLCELEVFDENILEPCCGEGHISEVLKKNGYNVTSRDLIDRGYGEVADFLTDANKEWNGDIITNPPYKLAQEFVEKSLDIIPEGNKVAMFLKLQFLEGKKRKELFVTNPPKTVYVSSSRLKCGINGDFDHLDGSAIAYAWFVWEKGHKGNPEIKWFN